MISYRTTGELRETIEQLLHAPTSATPEEFHEVAAVYSDMIISMNHRTALCNRLLDQGLRSEAMHIARIDPDLLDTITILDLGDLLKGWTSLCAANDAASPPPANWALAAHLHDAWESENRIEPQSTALRKAMLEHADTPTRIKLLLEIEAVDPGNPAVDAMISEHESQRINEIMPMLDEAVSARNLVKVRVIDSELNSVHWKNPPSLKDLEKARQGLQEVREYHTKKEFKRLSSKLVAAMQNEDEMLAASLASRWRDLAQHSKAQPRTESSSSAEPVFQWLKQLHEAQEAKLSHALACDQLNRMLDEEALPEDLERQDFKVNQSGLPVPDLLQQRYRDRTAKHRREDSSRRVFRVVIAITCVLAIVVLTVFFVRQGTARNRLNDFQKRFQAAFVDGILGKLEVLQEEGNERFPDAMRGELAESVDTFITVAKARQASFHESYLAASSLDDEALASWHPNSYMELAATEEEKALVEELKARGRNWAFRQHQNHLAELEVLFIEIEVELKSIERAWEDDHDPEEMKARVGLLAAKMKLADDQILRLESGSSADEVQSKLDDLSSARKRVAQLEGEGAKRMQQAAALTQLNAMAERRDVSAVDRMQAIRSFLSRGFDHPYREELKQSVSQLESIAAIDSWNSLQPELIIPVDNLAGWNAKAINIHQPLLEALSMIRWPHRTRAEILHRYLRENLGIMVGSSELSGPIDRFLSRGNSWMNTKLLQVTTNDGILYTLGNKLTEKRDDTWLLEGWIANESQIKTGSHGLKIIDKTAALGLGQLKLTTTGVHRWQKSIKQDHLLESPPGAPDTWSLDLLASLAAIEDMTPTFRALIAGRIAYWHTKNHWFQSRDMKLLAELNGIEPDKNWPDPDEWHAGDERITSEHLYAMSAEGVQRMRRELTAAIARIVIPPAYRCVGMIWTQGDNKVPQLFDSVDGKVLCMSQDLESWKSVGTAKDGKVTLQVNIEDIPVGYLLYMKDSIQR